jgi:hypothetical protein
MAFLYPMAFLSLLASSIAAPCRVETLAGNAYDLGALGTIHGMQRITDRRYVVAVCGNVENLLAHCPGPDALALVQLNRGEECERLGDSYDIASSLADGRLGFSLSLSGGSACADGPRSVDVTVECLEAAYYTQVFSADDRDCRFSLAVRARAGCPLSCARDNVTGLVCGGPHRGKCTAAPLGKAASCACAPGFGGPTCAPHPSLAPKSETHQLLLKSLRWKSKNALFFCAAIGVAATTSTLFAMRLFSLTFSASDQQPSLRIVSTVLTLVACALVAVQTPLSAADTAQRRHPAWPRVAMVIIAQGDAFYDVYSKTTRPSHARYTAQYGYSLVEVRHALNAPNEPSIPCMQKYLLFRESWTANYDYLILMDADIYISQYSPPIHTLFADFGGRIGAVDEWPQPTGFIDDKLRLQRNMRWSESTHEFMATAGFQIDTQHLINSGLLVLQPALHASFAADMYTMYAQESIDNPNSLFENCATQYELETRGLWASMPSEWNAIWLSQNLLPGNPFTVKHFVQRVNFAHLSASEWKYTPIPELDAAVLSPEWLA